MKPLISLSLFCFFWIHFACSQPMVVVMGIDDSLAIKRQVTKYLHVLDVKEKVHLSVCFTEVLPTYVEGMTLCLNTSESEPYKIIRVRINAHLEPIQRTLVLAHEMIHVRQFARGELRVNSKHKVIWKGKTFWTVGGSRTASPWEDEAYQISKFIVKQNPIASKASLASAGKHR